MNLNSNSPLRDCHFIGRIDLSDPSAPVFHYAGSYLVTRFRGASLEAVFSDEGGWNECANQLGFFVDGGEMAIRSLVKGAAHQRVEVARDLPDSAHSLMIVKLQGPGNGRGSVTLHELRLEAGKKFLPPPSLPRFKIEAYGDSVTEGEGAACPEGTNDCGPAWNNGWLS